MKDSRPSLESGGLPLRKLRKREPRRAFTLAELMVSLAASAIVVGAMVTSAFSLRRGLHSNEVYAGAYADQRRLTDYIGRDLRRAIAISYTNEAGVTQAMGGEPITVTIADRASLVLTLPAYYRSTIRTEDAPLEVVTDGDHVDYGSSAGAAAPVEVRFRKVFSGNQGCVCFVRMEAGQEEIVVRNADNLAAQVTVAADAQSAKIQTWFHSTELGPHPLVTTFDHPLLRNAPLTYRP